MTTKLKIETKVLKDILGYVSPAVDTKLSNRLAGTFLVEVHDDKIHFRGNNTMLEATYDYFGPFELEGEPIVFCVNQFLEEIINNSKAKNTVFEFSNTTEVLMKMGRAKHKVALENYTEFPKKTVVENSVVIDDPKKYIDLFKKIYFSVSGDAGSIYQSYNIESDLMVVTNGDQTVFVTEHDIETEKANPSGRWLTLAFKAAETLTDYEMFVKFDKKTNYIRYEFVTGILEYSISTLAGKYPDYYRKLLEEVEQRAKNFELTIATEELESTLNDCVLYYNKAGTMNEIQYFTIVVNKKSVRLMSEVTSLAEFDTKAKIKELKHKEDLKMPFEVHLDPKKMLDFLSIVEGDPILVMYENEPNGVFIYDSENPNIKYAQVTLTKEIT